MAIYQLGDHVPVIPASCYIAAEATIIGSVTLGERVSVMSGAVVRGDNEPIVIGDDSNIQENCVLHTDPGAAAHARQGRDGGPPGDAAWLHDRRRHLDRHPGRGAQQLGDRQGLPGRRRRRHHREQELPRPLGDLRLAGQGGARGERGQHHPHAHERRGLCPARQPVQEGPQADSADDRDRRARSSHARRSARRLRDAARRDARRRRTAADRQCRAARSAAAATGAVIDGVRDRRRSTRRRGCSSGARCRANAQGDRLVLSRDGDARRADRALRAQGSAPRPRRSPARRSGVRSARSITSWSARPIPSARSPSMPGGWGSISGSTAAIRDWGSRLLFFRCGDLVVEIAHDLKKGVSDAPDQLWGLSLAHARHRQGERAAQGGRHRRLRAARRPPAGQPGLHGEEPHRRRAHHRDRRHRALVMSARTRSVRCCHKIVIREEHMKTICSAAALGVAGTGVARLGAGRGERQLLGAGRMVHAGRQRVPEGDRHQGRHDAEGLGRDHRAAQGRGGEPEGRRLVRRHRRSASAGGRGGPDRGLQVAEAAASCSAWASSRTRRSGGKTVGIYPGALGFGYNTELLAKKKLHGAGLLGRPAEARVQGRDPDGQPELVAAPPTR